ncbi:MAG: hypothetical protein ACFB4I_06055 [Cyanophyceae cyanobacterium]
MVGDASPTMQRRIPFKFFLIALIGLGVVLRFVNLEQKFYWGDEVRTSMRVAGNTHLGTVAELFNNRIIEVESLRPYKFPTPEKGFGDTIAALTTRPEHPPLYFVLARLWTQFWLPWWGDSVAIIRSLSVLFGLLLLPAVYWLCRELFADPSAGLIGVAVVAISPLHLLYAQEARQYGLWTLAVALSGAALLRALRLNTRSSWSLYTATIILGLYSHLLFIFSIVGHGIYIGLTQRGKGLAYGRSLFVAAAAFMPWLIVILNNLNHVGNMAAEVQKATDLAYLSDRWFRNINQAVFNANLGSANLIVVLLTGYVLWFLYRTAPKRTSLLILTWVGVTALALMLPDLILGGTRSTRVRYVIPCYLGIQMAAIYWIQAQPPWVKTRWQKLSRGLIILFLVLSAIASTIAAQSELTWNKHYSKSKYYREAAQAINQSERPLVISDAFVNDILTTSYRLAPHVHLKLVTRPDADIPDGFSQIFLFSPSEALKQSYQAHYQLELAAEYKREHKLWRVKQ